jgi:hypothetical protein
MQRWPGAPSGRSARTRPSPPANGSQWLWLVAILVAVLVIVALRFVV